jgi:hypothetical protein
MEFLTENIHSILSPLGSLIGIASAIIIYPLVFKKNRIMKKPDFVHVPFAPININKYKYKFLNL